MQKIQKKQEKQELHEQKTQVTQEKMETQEKAEIQEKESKNVNMDDVKLQCTENSLKQNMMELLDALLQNIDKSNFNTGTTNVSFFETKTFVEMEMGIKMEMEMVMRMGMGMGMEIEPAKEVVANSTESISLFIQNCPLGINISFLQKKVNRSQLKDLAKKLSIHCLRVARVCVLLSNTSHERCGVLLQRDLFYKEQQSVIPSISWKNDNTKNSNFTHSKHFFTLNTCFKKDNSLKEYLETKIQKNFVGLLLFGLRHVPVLFHFFFFLKKNY
ncbi:hypothetical protein RFI_04146 [Reticulomyxa filosa]|uniref:Uncharacterized protein n=1 Tax=Reticulomyxa filosa TaxID=46433 RepID=X6P433_RETFI|nr:hypothetical protein RFI_04146 [Reticulomyxa filosa]|eukprot:ETO32961.1 hypothetical protein RFI_04146 [Reticulomyxa filosa]